MTSHVIIGIDPGVSGAIAFLTSEGEFLSVHDMPVMRLGKSNRVNAAELARIIQGYSFRSIFAVVERVQSMPKQGVASTFSFGHSAGVIEGVVATLGVPYELVTPRQWKKAYRLIGADKDAARAKAIQLYPKAPLSRKKDGGRADAILIARWQIMQRV